MKIFKLCKSSILIIFLLISNLYHSQIFGPNSPSTTQTPGAGNTWVNPNNVFSSNNSRASCALPGMTKLLKSKGFGFSLLATDIVQGIRLEVEKSANVGDPISLISGWQDGTESKLDNFPLTAGSERMLVLFVGAENGNEPTVNNITYGGLNLTLATQFSFQTSFWAHLECWYLLESDLATLAIGNHNIVVNYNPFTDDQFFDITSAALFSNVDQINPFLSFEVKTVNGAAPASIQFNTPLVSGDGGMFLTGIFCGNVSNQGSTNGQTNNFSINSTFIEGTDIYRANQIVSPTSGGCLQTAYKISSTASSENPTVDFDGSANRRLMIGIGLRKVTTLDEGVYLLKSNIQVGTNLAQLGSWPISDVYTSYGGPGVLWGTTWNFSDINNANFGAQLQADIVNGSALIDHVRITVFTTSVLPVTLIDFQAKQNQETVDLTWLTGSEQNSDYYLIERSSDGINFELIGNVKAVGNSSNLQKYSFTDENPLIGLNYYRLKQFDMDGRETDFGIQSVTFVQSDSQVFPNPVSDWGNVFSLKGENLKYMIVNLQGKIIDTIEENICEEKYQFNISNQPDGQYYLIESNNCVKKIYTFQKITQ